MSRVWAVVAGAAVTVYGASKVRKATEVFTADGARDRWQAWTHGAKILAEDVRGASRARKEELRHRYGVIDRSSAEAIQTHVVPELETAPDESEPR